MTPKPNDGGPAFPIPVTRTETRANKYGQIRGEQVTVAVGGMTLRDAIAIAAMQGMLSCKALDLAGLPKFALAQDAWQMADAMIKERERQ